MIRFLYLAKG